MLTGSQDQSLERCFRPCAFLRTSLAFAFLRVTVCAIVVVCPCACAPLMVFDCLCTSALLALLHCCVQVGLALWCVCVCCVCVCVCVCCVVLCGRFCCACQVRHVCMLCCRFASVSMVRVFVWFCAVVWWCGLRRDLRVCSCWPVFMSSACLCLCHSWVFALCEVNVCASV